MDKSYRSSACIEFALINAADPVQVARFMFWLERGQWPEEWREIALRSLTEVKDITMEEYLEISWMWDAPRHRILKLLWQLLQDNYSEEYFWNRFTIGLDTFTEDAKRCAEVLPPIQRRLRWVLEGVEEINSRDTEIGQGSWGEEWFLPGDRATYVREQLRKVSLDLLEKSSDYEEMLEMVTDVLIRNKAQAIDIPVINPDRIYVGEIPSRGGSQIMWVWVEAGHERQGVVNADNPWRARPGSGFGWGYGGGGPRVLAVSLLADATGGDLALAEQHWEAFRNDVVERLPVWEPFRLSRVEVLAWLAQQGVGEAELHESQVQVHRRKEMWGPQIEELKAKLLKVKSLGGLRAQRFDYVPEDFESALYVDLMEMLKRGGRILRCARCNLPISYDGSSRSNRQRARWEAGRPIYHDQCGRETRTERKRAYWRRLASDRKFREERRRSASTQRLADRCRKLARQGEGQRIEFKQSFAEDNEAIISLCAFTHADGGTVLFGVADDGSFTGVHLGKNTLENFANKLGEHTQPPLTPCIETVQIDEKVIVLATIERAQRGQLFYAFNTPYIRVGKTNQVMTPPQQQARLKTNQNAYAEEQATPTVAVIKT